MIINQRYVPGMGGGGTSGGKLKQAPVSEKKIAPELPGVTKRQGELIAKLKEKINVDITGAIEPRLTSRKHLTIWTSSLNRNDMNNIRRWQHKYGGFDIQDNGKDKVALTMQKEVKQQAKSSQQRQSEKAAFRNHYLKNVKGRG